MARYSEFRQYIKASQGESGKLNFQLFLKMSSVPYLQRYRTQPSFS